MQDYRAFVVGPDGHVLQRHEFWCANDEEGHARQFVDGKDVEPALPNAERPRNRQI
jgi:hypothetical protein